MCILVTGTSSLLGAVVATASLIKAEKYQSNPIVSHESVAEQPTAGNIAAVISKASTLRLLTETTTRIDARVHDARRVDFENALEKFRRLVTVQGSIDRKALRFIIPEWFDETTGAFHYVVFAHDVAITLAVVLNSSHAPSNL